ncbi:hypothetical protein GCM10027294_26380 [Marinactinospora endophytica]
MQPGPGNPPPQRFLGQLRRETRRRILGLGRLRTYGPGDPIARQGEVGDIVYLLLRGHAKISAATEEGRSVLLAIRGSGDLLGVLELLRPHTWQHNVVSVDAVQAVAIGAERLRRFVERDSETALAVSGYLARLLRESEQRFIEAATHSARQRLSRVLSDLADQYGRVEGGRVRIDVDLTQGELASLIAASEPTVHRELGFLRRRGIVEPGYRRIVVLDLPALRRVAVPGTPAVAPVQPAVTTRRAASRAVPAGSATVPAEAATIAPSTRNRR